jgi:hypothetical protein
MSCRDSEEPENCHGLLKFKLRVVARIRVHELAGIVMVAASAKTMSNLLNIPSVLEIVEFVIV